MNESRYTPGLFQRPQAPARDHTPPASPAADDEIDLLALLQTLWRGKWLVGLITALAVLAGGYYAFVAATPMYTASATVVLDSREEQIVDLQNVMSGLSGNQETLNTEVEVLSSRGLAKQLVQRLNLTEDPEFNPTLRPEPLISVGKVVGAVKAGLARLGVMPPPESEPMTEREILDATVDNVLAARSVSNVRQSYVFRVNMLTESPEKSARMADTLAQVYIDDQLSVKYAATEKATEWLTEQVAELKSDLEEAEAKVKEFNASTSLISPEALEALNRQLKDTRERLVEAQRRRDSAEERVALLEAAQAAEDRAWMLESADNARLRQMAERDVSAEAFNARYDRVEAQAAAELQRAQSQVDALESSAADLEKRIDSQSEDLVRLQQLQREAEASGTIYAHFLSRLKETSVQKGIQQSDSRVLSEAVVPRSASQPRKPLVLALCGMLGLFAGAALVLGREAASSTFRTSEDLSERTGYPVMGSVPKIPARRREKVVDYVLAKPTSSAAEAIRNLRTSLMLSNVDTPPQVILSTSSVPGEGKTTQSILLAHNFAALGKRVLLVEGDMRRRVFAEYFDLELAEDTPSLVSILGGDATLAEAVRHVDKVGVDLLVSARSNVNAADLYTSEKFATLLAEMRARYDIVIIDTPPVLVVPDARVIAGQVDAVLFTVKWDATQRGQVRDGVNMLESVGVRVSGLVLAQVDPKGMKRYGYGGYGGYYGGYSGYYDN